MPQLSRQISVKADEVVEDILLVLWMIFSEDATVEDMFSCSSVSRSAAVVLAGFWITFSLTAMTTD